MCVKFVALIECFATYVTDVRFLSSVNAFVFVQIGQMIECFVTYVTDVFTVWFANHLVNCFYFT